MTWEIHVDRTGLVPRVVPTDAASGDPAATRFRVLAATPTANTATYCRLGGSELPFFDAFTEPGVDPVRVPSWNVLEVLDPGAADVTPGSLWLGYAPLAAEHATVTTRDGAVLVDTAPRREFLVPWYRTLLPVPDDLDPAVVSAVWPVFPASYAVAVRLRDAGVHTAVLTSASSRTALGTAHALRTSGIRLEGVTSAASVEWVRDLGLHDEVRSYDDEAPRPGDGVGLVDLTGSPDTFRRLDAQYAGGVSTTLSVGYTHPDCVIEPPEGLRYLEPEVFFTPMEEEGLREEHGAQAYDAELRAARDAFTRWYGARVPHRSTPSPEELAGRLDEVLRGTSAPTTGLAFRPAA